MIFCTCRKRILLWWHAYNLCTKRRLEKEQWHAERA